MSLARTYRIETERLVLRCYQPGDALKLQDAVNASLDHLRPWLPWAREEPKGLEAKIALIRLFRGQFDLGQDYIFGIFNKTETELIGSTGLHTRLGINAREIGYWIGKKHIGQGYATEVVAALMLVGFGIEGLSRIEIHCAPDNIRSQRIPQKLGYRSEGALKSGPDRGHGEAGITSVWSMTRKEYEAAAQEKRAAAKGEVKAFDIAGRAITFAHPI